MSKKQFMTIIFLLFMCGCSTQRQTAEAVVLDPATGFVCVIGPQVSKTNFLYWSKFQADVDTFGMTTKVYNAEGKPDAESVKAIAEGVVKALLTP